MVKFHFFILSIVFVSFNANACMISFVEHVSWRGLLFTDKYILWFVLAVGLFFLNQRMRTIREVIKYVCLFFGVAIYKYFNGFVSLPNGAFCEIGSDVFYKVLVSFGIWVFIVQYVFKSFLMVLRGMDFPYKSNT